MWQNLTYVTEIFWRVTLKTVDVNIKKLETITKQDAGYEGTHCFSICLCVYVVLYLSVSKSSFGSRAPDFQEKQQPSRKLLKPVNICSVPWNLTSKTRIMEWGRGGGGGKGGVPKLQQLGLVPMISFPCQLLHHVLCWLAYPRYNLACFSFSHKVQNFKPVLAVEVKWMENGEKTKGEKLFWL
jgi:hypothetical protein